MEQVLVIGMNDFAFDGHKASSCLQGRGAPPPVPESPEPGTGGCGQVRHPEGQGGMAPILPDFEPA
ncbi:MAG: hypothetical protein ACPL8I_14685, partial [Chloroflexaceae bacterium]